MTVLASHSPRPTSRRKTISLQREKVISSKQKKAGLRGFFTRTGKEVIPISYESRSIWKEGALAVRGKDKKISFYKKMDR